MQRQACMCSYAGRWSAVLCRVLALQFGCHANACQRVKPQPNSNCLQWGGPSPWSLLCTKPRQCSPLAIVAACRPRPGGGALLLGVTVSVGGMAWPRVGGRVPCMHADVLRMASVWAPPA